MQTLFVGAHALQPLSWGTGAQAQREACIMPLNQIQPNPVPTQTPYHSS
jgi:hypothetical protein